jgi:hypothetical protein
VLTVTDVDRGRVLARERVEPGALIGLAYVHSTEGRPARATFRVEADRSLRLVETAFPSVGPGLPPLGPEDTWAIEDGLIVNRSPSPPQTELRLRAVPLTQHRLVLPSGRTLDLGALRYLQKPVRERDLLTAVEDAARLHRMARLKREALAAIGLEDRLPTDRAGLETRFGRALASVRLVFQPIVRATDGSVFGYEALVRTDEPSMPHPGALFEVAERLGRVHEVGGVVRDRVAALLVRVSGLTLFVLGGGSLHSALGSRPPATSRRRSPDTKGSMIDSARARPIVILLNRAVPDGTGPHERPAPCAGTSRSS